MRCSLLALGPDSQRHSRELEEWTTHPKSLANPIAEHALFHSSILRRLLDLETVLVRSCAEDDGTSGYAQSSKSGNHIAQDKGVQVPHMGC